MREFLFAASFGAYWVRVYDHLTWHRLAMSRIGEGVRQP